MRLLADYKVLPRFLDDNDLFYPLIGIAIAVMLLVLAWRRWGPVGLRRRRGACLKCGYELRGDFDAGCHECGWRREQIPDA